MQTQTTVDENLNLNDETNEASTTGGFEDMGLSPTTLAALANVGFTQPSPIQEHLVPPALEGRDCLGNAPTGTGKTAAFLIPIIEKLDDRDRTTQALILAPTRELVVQICIEFDKLTLGRRCRAVAAVGGESIYRQQKLLYQGCQLIVATPGRLIDLMGRSSARLDKVKTVVLDEADQMLDIGFRPAVEEILAALPNERQTLLLSATMPAGVRDLARRYLLDPVDVRLIPADEDVRIPEAIRQSYVMVEHHLKPELLVKWLQREQPSRAIVFCRTKQGADWVGQMLRSEGLRADAMHGDLSQAQRNRVLHAFRSGRLTTLVATDVVGRGIDVRGVSHVVNFDLPDDPANYIHRIGRTGRMGNDGAAVSFVVPEQGRMLDQIERIVARPMEGDEVEGIPSPPRPVYRPQRPAGRRGGPPRRGGRPPFRASNGLGGRGRRGTPQGAGRS